MPRINLPRRLPLGRRHRRPPERGRQRRQRHLVPRERDADDLPEPLRQGHERLGAVGVRPRPRRRDGPERLPVLGRVGARRAARGRVLRGGARPLRSGRRRMPRSRPRADRDVQPLHVAALVRRARRLARRRGARALRPLLRRRHGSLRRPDRARRHLQRARPARDAHVGGPARLRPRARARDARGGGPGRRRRALPRRQRDAARGLRRHARRDDGRPPRREGGDQGAPGRPAGRPVARDHRRRRRRRAARSCAIASAPRCTSTGSCSPATTTSSGVQNYERERLRPGWRAAPLPRVSQ